MAFRGCPGSPVFLLCVLTGGSLLAQPAAPKATHVGALLTYPGFFHGQHVIVRGEITSGPDRSDLAADGQSLQIILRTSPTGGLVDARGEFWDVGRMTPDDPRFAGLLIRDLLEPRFGTGWPKPGEQFLLKAESTTPASPPLAPTVRAIALDPTRYLDQRVTISGQFRGRNLYGDLPQAPGRSRWDFVLRSASAAVWVTGVRPRGKGFNLDINARVDTGRWLEVSGIVRQARGLVWVEAVQIELARPVADTPDPEPEPARPAGPPPEVIFSAPTKDETDVARSTLVRIQFSRDLDPVSLTGHVRVGYLGQQSVERGEPQPAAISFKVDYDGGRRVLAISFSEPLDRFRAIKVELLDGIVSTNGLALKPWSLTFNVGGT